MTAIKVLLLLLQKQYLLTLTSFQLHGRSRVQRYTKIADWDYIGQCAEAAKPMPLFGKYHIKITSPRKSYQYCHNISKIEKNVKLYFSSCLISRG